MKGQPVSVSKTKKAIADYEKAIGRPDGIAELSIFYCEEAFGFLESCSMDDEKYFAALIRMYGRSLEVVSSLPPAERSTYLERLGRLKSRGRNVGWVVEEEFNSPQRVYGRRQVQSLPPSVSQGFPPHRRTRS